MMYKVALRRVFLGILWFAHRGLSFFIRWDLRPVVLVYHSVSDAPWHYAVRPHDFERQIRYLAKHYHPVSLDDVIGYGAGEKNLPPRRDAVAVTFDDGYKDFTTHALPILEKYRIPATVFVCAGPVDRDALGSELALLTDAEIALLKANPLVSLGSHGATHRKLTRMPQEELVSELVRSKTIHGGVADIAYPKGSYNERVSDAARDAGFRSGWTVDQRRVRRGDPLFSLPRIQVDASTNWFEFTVRLTGVSDWYFSIRKLFV